MARDIVIKPVLNGFICSVGCQSVVFTTIQKLADELVEYYNNPEDVEKRYLKNAVNKPAPVEATNPRPTPTLYEGTQPAQVGNPGH